MWSKRAGRCAEVENWAFQKSCLIAGDWWKQGKVFSIWWINGVVNIRTRFIFLPGPRGPPWVLFWFCSVFFSKFKSQRGLNDITGRSLFGFCRLRKRTARRPWHVTQIRTQTIPEQVRWNYMAANHSCLFSRVETPGSVQLFNVRSLCMWWRECLALCHVMRTYAGLRVLCSTIR